MRITIKVIIVGIGMGNPDLLTRQATQAIEESNCIIGAKRMLDCFPEFKGEKFCAVAGEEIAEHLHLLQGGQAAVLVSGDVGFYSGTKKLLDRLNPFVPKLICGISSLQYFCAELATSWDDAEVVSVHGREANVSAAVGRFAKTFLLTGSNCTASQICRELTLHGLGEVAVAVGERLSYPDEIITRGTAENLSHHSFAPLSVLLCENSRPIRPAYETHGLEDDSFLRLSKGKAVPMTKQEVRTLALSKMRVETKQVIYDIGAGTGSVSVELAQRAWRGRVFAIEKNVQALELLHENRNRFSLPNLEIVSGEAPAALESLPVPDSVFIGGTSGKLEEILTALIQKNPTVRVVITAITLETVAEALRCFKLFALEDVQVSQLTAARAKPVGGFHMMMGQNPVTIFSGQGRQQHE